MKSRMFMAILPILVLVLTLLMLPIVEADIWGHYTPNHYWSVDSFVRCDHTSAWHEMGHPDDTWTGLSIVANYRQNPATPARYISGTWCWERGYGGGGTYADYRTDSAMFCTYVVDVYSTTFYNYSNPVQGDGFYHNNTAYYHDGSTILSYFSPVSLAPTLQGYTSSYFVQPNNTNNRWYVETPIYMTATYP